MANIRRGRRSFAVRGSRRETEWAASADSAATASVGPGVKMLDQIFSSALLAEVSPATIIRVRGWIYVQSDQVAAREEPFGALGFRVVSDLAATAGAASIPGPITNEDDEGWFVWPPIFVVQEAASSNPGGAVIEFDSKAMSKFVQGDAILVMLENAHGVFSSG